MQQGRPALAAEASAAAWLAVQAARAADSQLLLCALAASSAGYGIYATKPECLADGEPAEEDVRVDAAGVDPTTYPEPTFPATACPARARATGNEQRSDCPFQQSGLKRWDDPSTWGGTVPSPSSTITLPKGVKVLMGACMLQKGATYRQIIIPAGSELIFADEDMALDVGSIVVNGALRAGGPSCRLASRLTLTFHSLSGIDTFNMALWVGPGGTLDLHGKLFYPTWTRLAQTAAAGAKSLKVKDAVQGWEQGQQVVITTTIWKDEQDNQNEVVTIDSVSADRRTIYLASPLKYDHYGGSEYQAEVGLLSRYILVQGDAAAERNQKGPHIRVEGTARIRGVQTFRAGQINTIGAYPFHWHMVGDASGQMATDNSIYRSFYRCVTVHATNNLLVQNNVAFDDGVEEYNTIDGNLAAFVHVIGKPAAGYDQGGQTFGASGSLAQPSDAAASGFYISNPNNRVTSNAASGGYSGFIYPVVPKPTGLSRNVKISPAMRPMLRFDGNTAHSSGYMWYQAGCIYFGGRLTEDPKNSNKMYYNSGRHEFDTRDSSGKQAFIRITNTKVFLCMVGHMSWGQRFEVEGYQAFDMVRGATLFGQGLLKNAYINVQSGNTRRGFPGRLSDYHPIAGFQWYDTRTMTVIKDVTFANYVWQPQLGFYRMSVFYGMSSTKNITLKNVDYKAIARVDERQTGSSRMANWLDYDGSSIQSKQPAIVGSWPAWWNVGPGCQYNNDWNVWTCPWRQGQEVGRVELRIPGLTVAPDTGGHLQLVLGMQMAFIWGKAVPPTPANIIGYVAVFGYRGAEARKMDITRNEGVTGITGDSGWYFHFYGGAPKYQEVWLSQLPVGTHIIYASRFPSGTQFDINRNFKWFKGLNRKVNQVSSLNQVVSGDGLSYFFDGQHLFVKLVDPGNTETKDIDFCRDGVCVRGSRSYSLHYAIKATTLTCSGSLCGVADKWDDIPDALPGTPPVLTDPIKQRLPPISDACTDDQPTDGSTCAQKKKWGACGTKWIAEAGWCAATCGRCKGAVTPSPDTQPRCKDVAPPGGPSCKQQKAQGKCGSKVIKSKGYCKATCKQC
ncbi:hypothetical protein D9Q98_005237 [Chlorella vulgaris]|uniref:G8 domain-containing protein n=1 Tax=Chlorella vulgaris TaxID=3077 RepID=A0A9D4TP49_CHLVU|nr:hypothetical protein D9Q98_005237 [Chlorella vulgaris]